MAYIILWRIGLMQELLSHRGLGAQAQCEGCGLYRRVARRWTIWWTAMDHQWSVDHSLISTAEKTCDNSLFFIIKLCLTLAIVIGMFKLYNSLEAGFVPIVWCKRGKDSTQLGILDRVSVQWLKLAVSNGPNWVGSFALNTWWRKKICFRNV